MKRLGSSRIRSNPPRHFLTPRVMPEFYPDIAAFYAQPPATVKEAVQAKIRGNLMADANIRPTKSRTKENVATLGILAIASVPLIAYLFG